MKKSLLTLTASALILAGSMGMAQAQSSDDDAGDMMQQGQGMMQQGQQRQRMMQQGQQGQPMMRQGRRDKQEYGRYRGDGYGWHHRRGGGMGYGMGPGMGWGMGDGMGRGMGWGMGRGRGGGMGHGAMMQVVFAMMDADGNGSLALQEVQDAHARIFAHMDANDDGEVTKGEIRAFFRGGKDSRRAGRRDWSEMPDDTDDAEDLNLSDDVGDDDDDDN